MAEVQEEQSGKNEPDIYRQNGPGPLVNESPEGPPIRILYVDDDPDMSLFFQTYIRKMGGFEVFPLKDGRQALALLSKEHQFDIIVSDFHMPGMDGIDLLKQTRNIPCAPPFILFTGKGREEVVMEAFNNGAAFYLQKGGDTRTLFTELAHKIRQAVGKQKAETALRESEEKFRLLFESARDAIIIIKDGMVADCNQQSSVFFGISKESLIGKTIESLSPKNQPGGEESQDKWNVLNETALFGEHVFTVWKYQRADGSTFTAELSLTRIDLDSKPCLQIVIRDISERIIAEQELSTRNIELSAAYEELMAAEEERKFHLNEIIAKQERLLESEQKFRELSDLLPQMVFETDNLGEITYANRQAFETFGYEPGNIPKDFRILQVIHPEDRERAIESISRITSEGKTEPHEYRAIRRDGSIFPVIIHSAPIIRSGSYQGLRGIVIDITERKQYEEALIKSEEKYRTLIEHIQDGVFIIQNGRLQLINPAFAAILGYSVEEITGQKMSAFIAPEDREMVINRHKQRMKGENVPNRYEFRLLKSDGKTRVLISMDIGVISIQGISASIGTIRDVTREREAEEAVRESERRLAAVIDFLPDATMVIDNTGVVIAWNRAMEQLTGVPAREMLGRDKYTYSIPFYGERRPILVDIALHADDKYDREYTAIERSGDVIIGEAYTPYIKDGKNYLWGTASPLRNSRGEIVGAIESIRDITERKHTEEALVLAREELEQRVIERTAELTEVNNTLVMEIKERRLAEAALRESEERYRKLIELSPDAVFVHDGWTILFVNQAGIHLLAAGAAEDVIGRRLQDIIHTDNSNQVPDKINSTRLSELSGKTMEEQFIKGDGTSVDVEVSSAPIVYQGNPAVLVIVRDITSRKKAAEQLRQYAEDMTGKNRELDFLANQLLDINEELDKRVKERTSQVITLLKQKDEFIMQLGHDLKTPLTPLRALLPSLIEEEQNPDIKEALSVLLRSAHSIQDQTEKILTIARLSRDEVAAVPVPILIHPCILETVEKHALYIEKKRHTVSIDIPKDLTILFSKADAGLVFDNLIGNAIKYTPAGGNIRIQSHIREGDICIKVEDSGIGLSLDEVPHIFDEFYMADPSRHDRNSSGLGLSIVRRLVNLYGGTVRVESEGRGKGTTFFVCLPDADHPLMIT